MKRFMLAVLSLAAVFSLAACDRYQTENPIQVVEDSAITSKVKAALFDKLGSKGMAIQVTTMKDCVKLTGHVHSRHIKHEAGRIAANVSGVKHVKNELRVTRR